MEGSNNSKTTIYLNVDSIPFSYEANVVFQDYIIEGVVSVVKYLLDNNASIDLLSYKTEVKHVFGQNKAAFEQFYTHLARMMFSQHAFLDHLLPTYFDVAMSISQIMIFTPYVTDAFYEFLKTKIGNGNITVFIVEPKEAKLKARLNSNN